MDIIGIVKGRTVAGQEQCAKLFGGPEMGKGLCHRDVFSAGASFSARPNQFFPSCNQWYQGLLNGVAVCLLAGRMSLAGSKKLF